MIIFFLKKNYHVFEEFLDRAYNFTLVEGAGVGGDSNARKERFEHCFEPLPFQGCLLQYVDLAKPKRGAPIRY